MITLLASVIGMILFTICLAYALYKQGEVIDFKHTFAALKAERQLLKDTEARLHHELDTLNKQLQAMVDDPVTNLLGWKVFEDRLYQSIKEDERYQLTSGVLFVDLDDFSVINDALSYEVGNALLREVAARLKGCIRQVDSASRFAKDTFAILLMHLSKPETAAVVAQRVLQALAEPFQVEGKELYVTACVGIAIYPNDGEDAQAILRSANHALRLAKAKGKQTYQFYQEKMFQKSQRELALYTGLNQESIFQTFKLFYQPIIDVSNNKIFCMDALLYWQHPEIGMVDPQELSRSAERQLKSNMITEWLLQTICEQFKHWQARGFSPILLGLPISLKQLETSHFIYRISQLLQEFSFKPECILLEIQESPAMLSLDVLEKSFNMLKFIGVKIAIDHFGMNAFSLSHLKHLPIHYLKLDAALIHDIEMNPQAVALVKSLMNLANNLSMQIIIQGVESERQIEILKELGCTLMQGRLLGVPIAENEVEAKLVTH